MARIRQGDQQVLVVVDFQNAVIAQSHARDAVAGAVALAVARARAANVPVVWVRHSDEELPAGSPGWQIVPELEVLPGEPIVEKSFNSSFEDTDLEQVLAGLGATEIVLCGAATNWCVRATAYAALDRGYDLTLIGDAHTTESMADENQTIEAADIIEELNVAMMWLSYPGRTNRTVDSADLEFA